MADKIKKLSEAIRYGSTFLKEVRIWRDGNCGCALGTAYIATIGGNSYFGEEICTALSERFGVPMRILNDVSSLHYEGKKTRAECADWLEARGY